MTDWQSIKKEYEHGASQRSLAAKYGISRQAIIKRIQKEHWITKLVTAPPDIVTSPVTDEDEESDPAILALARRIIAQRLREEPENKDIKMLMDSFSQVKKIELLAPAGEEENSHHDMRRIIASATPEESITIRPALPVLHAISQRLQAEDQGNITPIRKLS